MTMIGMIVTDMSIAMTNRYPLYQPHFFLVKLTMNWPAADPRVPVPSMIPVTVETARELPFRASYFPKSAEQAEDIILLSPLMQKPRRNIIIKNKAIGNCLTVKANV